MEDWMWDCFFYGEWLCLEKNHTTTPIGLIHVGKNIISVKIVVGLNPEKLFITQFQSTMRFDFFQLKFIIPKSTVCLIFR